MSLDKHPSKYLINCQKYEKSENTSVIIFYYIEFDNAKEESFL